MWCWAASGKMTMDFLHPPSNIQECDEANKRFGRTDCCNSPVPGGVIHGGWAENEKYNFTSIQTSHAQLSWNDFTNHNYFAPKTLAFSAHWTSARRHNLV